MLAAFSTGFWFMLGAGVALCVLYVTAIFLAAFLTELLKAKKKV